MMTTITTILAYTLSLGMICSLFYVACRLSVEYLAMRKLKPLETPAPVEVPAVKQTAPKKKAAYKNPAKKQPTIKQDAAKKAATKKQPVKGVKKKTAVRKKSQTQN